MNPQYFYLIGDFLFFLIWLPLFLVRKDLRKEMILIGLIFGLAGIISEAVYLQDWWHPLTITHTAIGIEDFLNAFFIGSVASIIYPVLFNKKYDLSKRVSDKKHILSFFGFIFLLSFFILKMGSFYSSVLTFGVGIFILLYNRKDLIKNSLFSGIFMLIIGNFIYLVLNFLYPGFVHQFWYLDEWYSLLILGIPLKEYIWYFLAGAFIGPLYEYKEGIKLKGKH